MMEIQVTNAGFEGYTNGNCELTVTINTKSETTEVCVEGKMVTIAAEPFKRILIYHLEQNRNIELDLSKTSFLCTDAVHAIVESTLMADRCNLHLHIKAISYAAYENIHTVNYISQILSGELNPVPCPPEKEKAIPSQGCESNGDASSEIATRLLQLTEIAINELQRTMVLEKGSIVPILVHLPTQTVYRGEQHKTTIGRAEICDIRLPNQLEYVSRVHAHIVQYENAYYLVADQNAKNETLIDGIVLNASQPALLKYENWIQLANEPFFLTFAESNNALPLSVSYLVHEETNECRYLKNENFLLGRENPWRIMTEKMNYIGRRHAIIVFKNGQYYLRDEH